MMNEHPYSPLLDEPQFSRDDVFNVCGISSGVLKGILDRKQVLLATEHNPGTGRRRMFTGSDVLKINTAVTAGTINFPLRWAYLLADQVVTRANTRRSALGEPEHRLKYAFYPAKDGEDWAIVAVRDDEPVAPLPIAVQLLDVDRLIDETLAKLNAIVDEQPIPSFEIPEVASTDPWAPENDFFHAWGLDDQGRRCLVGLTHEETGEYLNLQDLWIKDRSQEPDSEGKMRVIISDAQEARRDVLSERHEDARLHRLAKERAEKHNAQ